MHFPENLNQKIEDRKEQGNFRSLSEASYLADFYSNDYLGYARNKTISDNTPSILKALKIDHHGSTGSRLISGNHRLFQLLEDKANTLFNAEAALYFNSGYEANIGLLSAILKPKDVVFFDELCHASIRDGLQMSRANSYKFKHNDLEDLVKKIEIQKKKEHFQNIYIITESVFSMDGDTADLNQLVKISKSCKAYLIIDEAHALGVCGQDYKGLSFEFSKDIFARIYTCGKSLGGHGGFVLGSKALIDYLINFSRPFIYTTAASPFQVAQVVSALDYFEKYHQEKKQLEKNIKIFIDIAHSNDFNFFVSKNKTAIQYIEIKGNEKVKKMAEKLNAKQFGVKAILSPTVPVGKERIRICLHSFNTTKHLNELFLLLKSAM